MFAPFGFGSYDGGFILGLKALMYLILKTHASIINPMVFARRSISGMEW